MKKLLITLGLIASFSANADWVNAFQDNVRYEPTFSKRLKVNSDLVAVWWKVFQPNGDSQVTLEQYNCKDTTARFISYTRYLPNNQPDILNSFNWGEINNPFKDIEPQTFLARKFMFACVNIQNIK